MQLAVFSYHLVLLGFISFSFEWSSEQERFVWLPATRSLQQPYRQRALPREPSSNLITLALKSAFVAALAVRRSTLPHNLHVWPHLTATKTKPKN